jgi:hypothetical protein
LRAMRLNPCVLDNSVGSYLTVKSIADAIELMPRFCDQQ